MEMKKNPSKDLQKQYWLFFNIGLCLALGMVILAFEYKTLDEGPRAERPIEEDDFVVFMESPVTDIPEPPKPKALPPALPSPVIVEGTPDPINEEIKKIDLSEPIDDIPSIENYGAPIEEEPDFYDPFDVNEKAEPNKNFYPYLSKNIKYPKLALNQGIEGTVYVQFVVDIEGNITQIQVLRGPGMGLDEEAVRVLEKAPKWKPAIRHGKRVPMRMVLPVVFKKP